MRPRHVLHFIRFLLPSIVFYMSEELVVLITPCPLFAFNRKRLRGVSDVGAGNEKREVDKSFMTVDVSVSNVNNSLKNSNFKGAAHAKLNNSGKRVRKTPRKLAGNLS